MSPKLTWVPFIAICLAPLGVLAPFRTWAAGLNDDRPSAWRVVLQHVGETLPSDWSPPTGRVLHQPYSSPASWVTVRVAFEVRSEADCPEQLFAFHAGSVGVDLSAPLMPGGVIYSNQAQAPQNVHVLTLQVPRCRLSIRTSKAVRDGDGAWHRVSVWSQTGGPGSIPPQPEIDVADPKEREAARQRLTAEQRAWEKRVSDWLTPREKAVKDEIRRRDPARAAAIDAGQRASREFFRDGYADRFWFVDTIAPCFEASGYMVVGPSGLRLTYRPQFQRADPQTPSSGTEPLVPFSASVNYNDAGTSATLSLYSPTCRLEIGIDEELRTTRGWMPAPVKRSF